MCGYMCGLIEIRFVFLVNDKKSYIKIATQPLFNYSKIFSHKTVKKSSKISFKGILIPTCYF